MADEIYYTDDKVRTMHPRQQAILLDVPAEHRQAIVNRAHLLQNLQGGIFSQALWSAKRDLDRVGSVEALDELDRRDNHAAMASCARSGCTACARDAARLS
jgi:hypothetical protein